VKVPDYNNDTAQAFHMVPSSATKNPCAQDRSLIRWGQEYRGLIQIEKIPGIFTPPGLAKHEKKKKQDQSYPLWNNRPLWKKAGFDKFAEFNIWLVIDGIQTPPPPA